MKNKKASHHRPLVWDHPSKNWALVLVLIYPFHHFHPSPEVPFLDLVGTQVIYRNIINLETKLKQILELILITNSKPVWSNKSGSYYVARSEDWTTTYMGNAKEAALLLLVSER